MSASLPEEKIVELDPFDLLKSICRFWQGDGVDLIQYYFKNQHGKVLVEHDRKIDSTHDFCYYWHDDNPKEIISGMEPALISRYSSIQLKQALLDLQPEYADVRVKFFYSDSKKKYLEKVMLKYILTPIGKLF